ncbi:MAG: prepilin-type N-terminal cleavage/methylation domain-containing protein [Candidatus Zambryskibacteria bacterium]|nr:prepilin-type N-terminal cleavage/methylation domain-containing protein [Candidatus Zambryskibacteria bacterium]
MKVKFSKGFSLIEIMVAVSIFSVVMVLSTGSILSVLDANRKSQTLRAVMDNLNSTMESMTRSIRFGQNYHCGPGGAVPITTPQDCGNNNPSDTMAVLFNGLTTTYRLNSGRIEKSTNSADYYPITSPDVTITNLAFRVFGSAPYSNGVNLLQPQVIIVVSGFAGLKPTSQTTFTLETTVSQRLFDFQ